MSERSNRRPTTSRTTAMPQTQRNVTQSQSPSSSSVSSSYSSSSSPSSSSSQSSSSTSSSSRYSPSPSSPVRQTSALSPQDVMQFSPPQIEDQLGNLRSSISNLEQCCRDMFQRDQELYQKLSNLQQIINVIIRSMIVTVLPVNVDGAITYIPLANEYDLNQFGEVARVFPLGSEYLNILMTQSQIGMTLASGFSNMPLHQIKPNHTVYIIEFVDGRRVATYGQVVGLGNLIFE